MNKFTEYLKEDLKVNFPEYYIAKRRIIFNKRYQLIYLFRLSQALSQTSGIGKCLYKIINQLYIRIQFKFSSEIPVSCKIGKGFYLPHPYGIILNPNTVIGEYCTVLQQVTVGNNSFKEINGVATIGNNVTIGAGAKIIGKLTIGDNAHVGANAVVVRDVQAKSVVAGVPAKLIRRLEH